MVFFARCAAVLLTAFGLAAGFNASAFAQGFARPDGSVPVPMDWSAKHVLFTAGFTPEQAEHMWNEPRAYAQWLLHGNAPEDSGIVRKPPTLRKSRRKARGAMKKDWAISLGAGGVAQGMLPAKYTFDINATPSCAADFVVFPVNASTGTRAPMLSAPSAPNRPRETLRPSP